MFFHHVEFKAVIALWAWVIPCFITVFWLPLLSIFVPKYTYSWYVCISSPFYKWIGVTSSYHHHNQLQPNMSISFLKNFPPRFPYLGSHPSEFGPPNTSPFFWFGLHYSSWHIIPIHSLDVFCLSQPSTFNCTYMSDYLYSWYNSWLYLSRHSPFSCIGPKIFLNIFFSSDIYISLVLSVKATCTLFHNNMPKILFTFLIYI
jgi:hypothetical protein